MVANWQCQPERRFAASGAATNMNTWTLTANTVTARKHIHTLFLNENDTDKHGPVYVVFHIQKRNRWDSRSLGIKALRDRPYTGTKDTRSGPSINHGSVLCIQSLLPRCPVVLHSVVSSPLPFRSVLVLKVQRKVLLYSLQISRELHSSPLFHRTSVGIYMQIKSRRFIIPFTGWSVSSHSSVLWVIMTNLVSCVSVLWLIRNYTGIHVYHYDSVYIRRGGYCRRPYTAAVLTVS